MTKEEKQFERKLKSFIIGSLRRASLRWPERNQALVNARKERGRYECAMCHDTFGPKEVAVDHTEPVVPLTGYVDFETFIRRLFVPASKLQVLCHSCHDSKSMTEDTIRAMNSEKLKQQKKLDKKQKRE